MGTIITGIIVGIFVVAAIISIRIDKKNGKSVQCGVDCSKCSGRCH